MNIRHSLILVCVLAVAELTLSGCGSQPVDLRPKRVPVSGTVRYKNELVEGATIVFHPEEHPHAAAGKTLEGGQFRLRTFDPDDGAVPGKFKVSVRKFYFVGDVEHQILPVKYGNPDSAKLTATVVDGQPNTFTFELAD